MLRWANRFRCYVLPLLLWVSAVTTGRAGTPTTTQLTVTLGGTGVTLVPAAAITHDIAQGTANQTITFPAPPQPAYVGTSVLLAATSSSGLPVSYAVISGPAVVNGSVLTYTGPGAIVVEANQAGVPGSIMPAPSVQASVTATNLVSAIGVPVSLSTTVVFINAGTVATIGALTSGTPNLDFTLSPGGTCTVGQNYPAGGTCTVNFTFEPTYPGTRFGGISLSSSTGALLADTNLRAKATGSEAVFSPAAQFDWPFYSSRNGYPGRPQIDGLGDIYFTDPSTQAITEYIAVNGKVPANPQTRSLQEAYPAVDCVLDASGNLYVLRKQSTVYSTLIRIDAVNGVIPDSPVVETLFSPSSDPASFSIDALGNVFLLTGNEQDQAFLVEYLAVNGLVSSNPVTTALPASYGEITDFAFDASENLYAADAGNNEVIEYTAASGYQTFQVLASTDTQIVNGPPLSALYSVAVDPSGNVYLSDVYGLKEILAVDGVMPANPVVQQVILSNAEDINRLNTDNHSNVYMSGVTDGSGALFIQELDVADPPMLTFAPTPIGQTSSDSPQSVTLTNGGNADMQLLAPTSGTNPFITSGFTFTDSCAILQPGASAITLQPGQSCTYDVSFSPVTVGVDNGALTTLDNALDTPAPGAAQIIPLQGTGLGISFIITAPATATVGQPFSFTVTATDGVSNPLTSYTGTIHFTSTDSAAALPGNATLTNGVGTFSATLNTVGTQTISGTDTVFPVVTGVSNPINVNPRPQYSTAAVLTSSPSPVVPASPVTLTATLHFATATQTPTGTVAFYDNATLLGTATLDSANGTSAAQLQTTAGASGDLLSCEYSGDANFAAATCNPLTIGKNPSTTVASVTPNPSTYGQAVLFTAKVASSVAVPAGTPALTGSVLFTFCHGATNLVRVDSTGTASYVYPSPGSIAEPVSSCPFTAMYQGDASYLPSTSASATYIVTPAHSTTTIAGQPNPQYQGQPVNFAVTVAGVPIPSLNPITNQPMPPAAQTATGTVQVFDGPTLIGTGTLANGQATVTTSTLSVGQHSISATYSGDANLLGSAAVSSETILSADFTIAAAPPAISIQTEHNGSLKLTLDSSQGFSGSITLQCAPPLPAYLTCELPTAPITMAAGVTTTVPFEMDTDAVLNFWGPGNGGQTSVQQKTAARTRSSQVALACGGVFALLLLGLSRRRTLLRLALVFALLAALTSGLTACGSQWPGHTPPGVYPIQVLATGTAQGTAYTLTHTVTVTLTVTP